MGKRSGCGLNGNMRSDRIVETYMILEQLRCCNDPFGGKAFAVWLKPAYYVLGYVVILPLTLMWYKKYYQMLTRDDEAEVEITIKIDVELSETGDNSGDDLDRIVETSILSDDDDVERKADGCSVEDDLSCL